MTISPELIRQLAEFDAATLYEAVGQRGMVDPAIKPMWLGAKVCGPAVTVSCPPRDNLMLHHAVAVAAPGSVLLATAEGYEYARAWGEVLSVAAQARGIAGLVIDGAVRDIEAITERRFPVFSRGLAIGACKKEQIGTLHQPIDVGGVRVHSRDIVVGTAGLSIDRTGPSRSHCEKRARSGNLSTAQNGKIHDRNCESSPMEFWRDGMMESRRYRPEEPHKFCCAILERLKVAPEGAKEVADCLLQADLRGVDSHVDGNLLVRSQN